MESKGESESEREIKVERRLLRKGENEMKDKRILEGRESEMKVERAGMWDDEKKERGPERDRKHLSINHPANITL